MPGEPRGGLLRTKTGCLTCRIRRVKCDETKPLCLRCSKTGRQCDGYSSIPISRRELIARQLPDPNLSATERKSFDYFRLRTAKANWDIILQLSHLEPSIRHGVLALGSMHHDFNSGESTALRAYDKAIQHTRSLKDTNKILAACVIFVSYEYLNNNYAMANMHLQNGINIAKASNAEDELVQLLGRLDYQSMTFKDAKLPYSYATPEVLDARIPASFSTAKDARSYMVEILRISMQLMHAFVTQSASTRSLAVRESCRIKLREWKVAFDRSRSDNWVPMPRFYWMLGTLIVEAGCENDEMAWDEHISTMDALINAAAPLARIKSFSLEMGTTLPLFTVAIKCRDPSLRRKAIDLMKTPRREGIWYSPAASKVAETIMIREEGSRLVEKAQDIPKDARIRSVTMENMGDHHVRTTFQTRLNGNWSYQEQDVVY